MTVVVFGSINMDLVARVPRLPVPGETLRGSDFFTAPGGKGANQAAACARLGTATTLVGRVGDDAFGANLSSGLKQYGVDITQIAVTPGPSGVALIQVEESGQNSIVIISGANGQMGDADLERLNVALAGANMLLLQLEVPLEAVTAAARLARARGVTVMLDPAPAALLPDELYFLTDIITPNETECAALVGFPVTDATLFEKAAKRLVERGVKQVIIKLGERGAYLYDGKQGQWLPAFKVDAVDTTAAGDAFNGALAAALSEGMDLRVAVRFANAAGAISATRYGAQPSMPNLEEVKQLLQSQE